MERVAIGGIVCVLSIGGFFGLHLLTYTPELSHAESVTSKKTLADIEYMQDITPQICTNTPEADASGNNQYQLKDSRDGKTYWVAKLKDGNCWMTQDLAINILASGLSASDTDILADWKNGVQPTESSVMPESLFSTAFSVDSYFPGNYVYTAPNQINYCGSSIVADLKTFEACTNYKWVETSALTPSVDPTFGTSIIDSRYNAHYLIGNYYSWKAASAGNIETNSSQSICPKGWTLPNSGSNILYQDESFYNLMSKYVNIDNDFSFNYATYDIRLSPMYFLLGGYTYKGRIGSVGSAGFYWTRTAGVALYLDKTRVITSHNRSTYFGHQVRCIARKDKTNNVDISIKPTVILDVTNEVEVKKSESNPSTAELDVKVTSNQGYSVQINAKDHAELTSNTTDVKIPSASGTLNGNSNGWGIKKPGEESYTEVTTTPQLFYQSTVAEIKTIPFIIGISTSSDIPNGEYSTDIMVTAVQN